MAYKIRQTATRIGGWIAFALTASLVLAPVSALAASETYAIACIGSSISNSDVPAGDFAFCPDTNTSVAIEGVGHASKPYPKNSSVATVSVGCSSGSPAALTIGQPVTTVVCQNGSKPTFKSFKVVQSYKVKSKPSPAPGPSPSPSSSCNANNCDLIGTYIEPVINLLSVIFGLITVISLLLGAIQFSASEGDPQKAARAKNRISNTIIALIVYSLFYGFLQFLVPGGIFN